MSKIKVIFAIAFVIILVFLIILYNYFLRNKETKNYQGMQNVEDYNYSNNNSMCKSVLIIRSIIVNINS